MSQLRVIQNSTADVFELWNRITERHLVPEDTLEVVALLESMGWTDARVTAQTSFMSVFDLADFLWASKTQYIQVQTKTSKRMIMPLSFLNFLKYFLRGALFALPMLLSVAAMMTLRFSLWSYQYLSVRLATVIAIGTILSFLTVGGFMQAIARRGYFYLSQGYFRMARLITIRFIVVGISISVVVSVLLAFLDVVFPLLPMSMVLLCISYYLILNSIWLAVAVMYVLNSELLFTGLIALGIGCVFIFFEIFHINILLSQLLAMAMISLISIVLVLYMFRRAERKGERGLRPRLPRSGITVYSIMPYALYGFLYFALLFTDRILAWSTSSKFMPYFIWFRGKYELGLDFALVMLVIPLGVSEVLITKMMLQLESGQHMYGAQEAAQLSELFLRKYRMGMLVMSIVAALSGIVDYLVVHWVVQDNVLSSHQGVSLTPITNFVFIVGIISYGTLSAGLLNAVTMFSLSRPDVILHPLWISIVCNVAVGFVGSRWFHYDSAVWGLLVGCIVFSWMTTHNSQQVLRNLDYHLYLMS